MTAFLPDKLFPSTHIIIENRNKSTAGWSQRGNGQFRIATYLEKQRPRMERGLSTVTNESELS